jgi:protein O-GlcNAc transferase
MSTKYSQMDPNIHFQQALQLQQNGRLKDAESIYKNLLQTSPSHVGAKTMLGMIYVQTERDIDGIRLLKSSLIKDPKQFWAHNALGAGLLNTKQYQEATFSFNKALILKPDYTDAYFNLGKTQRALRKYEDAIISYSKCIDLDKNYASAYNNSGTIYLEDLKEYEKSVTKFQQFVILEPNSFLGHYNLGTALKELKRYAEALQSLDLALQLNPAYTEAYLNQGAAYHELKFYDDALVSNARAIQLKPDYAEAYLNRGVTYHALKRYDDAFVSYRDAIQLKPDYAEAYLHLGITYQELRRYDEALESYDCAIQLKPEMNTLLGNVIHTKMNLCDWDKIHTLVNQLTGMLIKQEMATVPFVTLALTDDPELQKKSAEIYINVMHPISNTLPKISKYQKHQKIRIGYFSADFRNHPVSFLTAELFELHNRDQFEIIAFSFGLNTQDPMRQRLERGFDQFIDIREKSDVEIATLAREMEIDIAVDLGGFTQDYRVNIFAMRAAPIQISYIGYLGTMGAEYFDYLVADPFLIPKDKQQFYSEKIVYIPSYQANDSRQVISDKAFTREEVGLPENAFVFCCFNNIYKITPATFDSWMRILNKVNDSVLLLIDANETATKNLKKEATSRGVDANRLVFGKRLPLPEYLARYRIADLFLDTLPYNAGTTASDALRVGLPVLTQAGESFASRIAGSLLNAIGLPELITATQDAYESLAIELATNPEQLRVIKDKLVRNLPTSLLYNTKLFTQHIELAYQEMHQRYQDDLTPDHIYIKS